MLMDRFSERSDSGYSNSAYYTHYSNSAYYTHYSNSLTTIDLLSRRHENVRCRIVRVRYLNAIVIWLRREDPTKNLGEEEVN